MHGQVEHAAASKLFAIAWMTGLRAGELLALTVSDLNFANQTICMNESSDDRTREFRQPRQRAHYGAATDAVRIGNRTELHALLETNPYRNSLGIGKILVSVLVSVDFATQHV